MYIVAILAIAFTVLVYSKNGYVFLISLSFFTISFFMGFLAFIDWFYDIYIVTNMRVVMVDQKNILHREVTEIEARDIVSVRCVQRGLFAHLFRYGTVILQITNGHEVRIGFAINPDYTSQLIHGLSSAVSRSHA